MLSNPLQSRIYRQCKFDLYSRSKKYRADHEWKRHVRLVIKGFLHSRCHIVSFITCPIIFWQCVRRYVLIYRSLRLLLRLLCSVSVPDTWAEHSNRNIQQSQSERNGSQRLRQEVDALVAATHQDMWTAWANSNTSLTHRVGESNDTRNKLLAHRDRVWTYKAYLKIAAGPETGRRKIERKPHLNLRSLG